MVEGMLLTAVDQSHTSLVETLPGLKPAGYTGLEPTGRFLAFFLEREGLRSDVPNDEL